MSVQINNYKVSLIDEPAYNNHSMDNARLYRSELCRRDAYEPCFGVFRVEKEQCLITWGEVFVCRFSMDGNKVWEVSGADIFTQGFELTTDTIEVIDFNNDKYSIKIRSGKIKRKNRKK